MTSANSETGSSLSDPFAGLETVIPEAMRRRLDERARPFRPGFSELPLPAGRIACRGGLPGRRRALAIRSVCSVVRTIAGEMIFLIGGRVPTGRNRRFAMSHIQQIAMYVCHVVLQITMTDIAIAFGRDRTTVGHACARVEDRRDDSGYDALIGSVERVVHGVFVPAGAVRS